ncbi:MAG: VOC family protein [Geminicoccaceae bacterium]|nr:VOC family protein [Geminicoccaceae bacterium]MCX7631360.1 VOC family protein [Geminicoccaceae bacterium]MDW8342647.1 VOC family protein [Geminicoccaceae bacterium]
MELEALDHVNIRTANLEAMVRWYEEVLGLSRGWRPGFDFGGAWLYLGDQPIVHLVEVAQPPANREPGIEHFAFRARGLGAFLARLEAKGVAYRLGNPPGTDVTQVNVFDPDGNHIHVDFRERP